MNINAHNPRISLHSELPLVGEKPLLAWHT